MEETQMCQLWGVMLGGAIALATTLINLGYNWLQQRSQRQFALRQAVYLETAEYAARGVQYLASFWRTDIDDNQLAQLLQSDSSAVYKVHAVGEKATIDALTVAGECVALKSLELMKSRVLLRTAITTVQVLQAEAAQSSAYLQQVASMIEGLPRSAPTPEILAAIPNLVATFTTTRDEVVRKQAEIASVQAEIVQTQNRIAMDGMKAAMEYQGKLAEFNIAARRELGIPLDEKEYRKAFMESAERMLSAVERALPGLQGHS